MRTPNWWRDYKRLAFIDGRWLIIWITIYLSFLVLDIACPGFWGAALLKYVGIFLCVVYARQKYPKDYNLQLALFFTLLADTILVWTPYKNAGVFVFCFAQFLHIVRLEKLPNIAIGIFAGLMSLILIISNIFNHEPLYALATIYGLGLINNIVISIRHYLKEKDSFRTRCALYGFIAFILCDICVALQFVATESIELIAILPFVSYMVWVFYYPSQVLIANSSTQNAVKVRKFAKTKHIS